MKTEVITYTKPIKREKNGQLVQCKITLNIVMIVGEGDTTFEGIILIGKPDQIGYYDDSLRKANYQLITEPLTIKFTPD